MERERKKERERKLNREFLKTQFGPRVKTNDSNRKI
jgi:hypothetical protein